MFGGTLCVCWGEGGGFNVPGTTHVLANEDTSPVDFYETTGLLLLHNSVNACKFNTTLVYHRWLPFPPAAATVSSSTTTRLSPRLTSLQRRIFATWIRSLA